MPYSPPPSLPQATTDVIALQWTCVFHSLLAMPDPLAGRGAQADANDLLGGQTVPGAPSKRVLTL
jgi:hypothetical protein